GDVVVSGVEGSAASSSPSSLPQAARLPSISTPAATRPIARLNIHPPHFDTTNSLRITTQRGGRLPRPVSCHTSHMPTVSAELVGPVDPATAFAVSQTTGQVRLRWDPFIRRQRFLAGATAPDRGVRTLTVHRSRLTMVREYVSYAPPR